MKKIIIVVFTMLFSQTVLANSVQKLDDRIIITGKISRIVTSGATYISVWLDGAGDSSVCEGGARWTINVPADELHDEKYSTLLAAATTGRTVKLMHLFSQGCGNWKSHKIYYVDVSYDGS